MARDVVRFAVDVVHLWDPNWWALSCVRLERALSLVFASVALRGH